MRPGAQHGLMPLLTRTKNSSLHPHPETLNLNPEPQPRDRPSLRGETSSLQWEQGAQKKPSNSQTLRRV